jgi:hypothetical protein
MSETHVGTNGGAIASANPKPQIVSVSNFHTVIENITPDRARVMLGKMRNPRPFSRHTAAIYAQTMRNGQWDFNGDAIRINEDDEVIDGQHRLHAVIQSGKPQKMLVMYGLKNEVFQSIDVGKRRSPGDMLAIAGYKHTINTGSVARALMVYESGVYWAEEAANKLDYRPTPKQIVKFVERNPDVAENCAYLANRYMNTMRLTGATPIGLSYTLAKRANEKKAQEFLDGVNGDVSTTKTDPRWVVRDFLMRQKVESKGLRRLNIQYTQAVMINAANLYFAGLEASVGLIRWKPEVQWFPRFDSGKSATRKLARRQTAAKREGKSE